MQKQIQTLITNYGVPITLTRSDGSSKTKTFGAYAKTDNTPEFSSALITNTTRTVYISGNMKYIPDVNDIITINKEPSSIQSVTELVFKGTKVAYVLVVTV